MIYDPLISILDPLDWRVFLLIYALFDIVLNLTLSYLFGRKQRVKEFLKDPLSILWPFFVLGPVAGGYLYIYDLYKNIQNGFDEIGVGQTYLAPISGRYLFWLIVLIAAGISISTRIRYENNKPNIWFSKPRFFGRTRTFLIDFPMAYMAIMALLNLVIQWFAIYTFLSSRWLPTIPFHIDDFYGIRWIYDIVITQITVSLIISLGPLVMMTREGKQKYSWIYKLLFTAGVIFIVLSSLVIANKLNHKIGEIHDHFSAIYINMLSFPLPTSSDTSNLLYQLAISTQLGQVMSLPTKLILPTWLENFVGIRLVVFLLVELYPTMASKFSLPQFSPILEKLLEKINK